MKIRFLKALASAIALAIVGTMLPASAVYAHGETNQEPFLRMRTVQWFDMHWSTDKLDVNGEVIITGKFKTLDEWPDVIPPLSTAFLSTGGPSSAFVKKESYINGVPMIQSTRLELGRTYDFKEIMLGRIPGRFHLHPTLMVEGGGPVVGPGEWVTISGKQSDFVYPVTTLSGVYIPNLETWGLGTVYTWHAIWIVIGLAWLVWWLRRPSLIPRYLAISKGREDVLVTRTDIVVSIGLIAVTLGLVYGGFQWADAKYPKTIPLQAGKVKVEPLPQGPELVHIKLVKADYNVPGRTMEFTIAVTNSGTKPVQLGELMSANNRFVNADVSAGPAHVAADYPKELVNFGLKVDDNRPIAPGETRVLAVNATAAAWETERLAGLANDPDNRFGGLLFFYDDSGNREIVNIAGPIIPKYI